MAIRTKFDTLIPSTFKCGRVRSPSISSPLILMVINCGARWRDCIQIYRAAAAARRDTSVCFQVYYAAGEKVASLSICNVSLCISSDTKK